MRQCHSCKHFRKDKTRKYDGCCVSLWKSVNNDDYCWKECKTPHEQMVMKRRKGNETFVFKETRRD